MNYPTTSAVEIDELRQEHSDQLDADLGHEWAKDNVPGSIGCHELLDRTSLLADNVEQFIVSHPACVRDPQWFALAEQAAAALRELYQRVGAEHLARDSVRA